MCDILSGSIVKSTSAQHSPFSLNFCFQFYAFEMILVAFDGHLECFKNSREVIKHFLATENGCQQKQTKVFTLNVTQNHTHAIFELIRLIYRDNITHTSMAVWARAAMAQTIRVHYFIYTLRPFPTWYPLNTQIWIHTAHTDTYMHSLSAVGTTEQYIHINPQSTKPLFSMYLMDIVFFLSVSLSLSISLPLHPVRILIFYIVYFLGWFSQWSSFAGSAI